MRILLAACLILMGGIAAGLGALMVAGACWFSFDLSGFLLGPVYPALGVVLGAFASRNPLASLGGSREIKLMMAYELPLVLAVLVPVVIQLLVVVW